jgi:hypothetical protein
MRIALLLSGLPRNWKPCIQSQLNMLKGHEIDVYWFFWDTISSQETRKLISIFNPVKFEFAPPGDFSMYDEHPDITQDNINIPSRIMSQYYAWWRVGELFKEAQNDYDVAIRSRSDLQFVTGIDDIIDVVTPGSLTVPWVEKNVFISDLFAVGSPEMIMHYHQLFDYAIDYAETTLFNPELLLAHHIFNEKFDLRIDDSLAKRFFVRRSYMKNMSIEECMRHPPGASKWLESEIIVAHEKVRGVAHVTQFRDKQVKYIKDLEQQ